jgi:REP element-mobilizing transposase RayT
MGAFKIEYIKGVKNSDWEPFDGKQWQRNYFEHIIRNKEAYENIAAYINNNPSKWNEDKFYRNKFACSL